MYRSFALFFVSFPPLFPFSGLTYLNKPGCFSWLVNVIKHLEEVEYL